MAIDDPFDLPALLEAAARQELEVADFFGSLDPDEFGLRVGSAWTPAQHLDHVNIAMSAVGRGFSVSRLLLRLRFGRARRPSRPFGPLVDDYRARLAEGLGASGRYVPAPAEPTAEYGATRQRDLLARWGRVNERFRAGLRGWSERDLDHLRLPHPILGRITAREMAFFALYHGHHHVAAAKRRLPRFHQRQP